MSVAELTPATAAPARLTSNWIVGAGVDLPWFIGGALAGYAMFFVHVFIENGRLDAWGLHWDMPTVWLIWWMLLDIPHFFGTYARTYLDKEDFRKRRRLLLGSLAFPLIGPAVILVCFGLFCLGAERYGQPYALLFTFLGLWAYWHVVRQHYGLMTLYKRKNNDAAPIDRWIDNALLYVGLVAPFVAMAARHPLAAEELQLPARPAPGSWHALLIDGIVAAAVLAIAAASLTFAVRQAYRWRTGQPINVPKVLFLLAVVPLHVFVCFHPAVLLASVTSFSAFVTIFHDIQYHVIVWHYQRNRIHRPGVDKSRFGLAALVSSHFAVYMGCAIAMGIAAWALSCTLKIQAGCMSWMPKIDSDGWQLFGAFTMYHVFFAISVGFIMHHYFVDQFIWRPSKDSELRADLRLNTAE
jgi:hypothetical protein